MKQEVLDKLVEHKQWLFNESYDVLEQLRENSGVITLLNGDEIEIDRIIITYLKELVNHDKNLLKKALKS